MIDSKDAGVKPMTGVNCDQLSTSTSLRSCDVVLNQEVLKTYVPPKIQAIGDLKTLIMGASGQGVDSQARRVSL